MSALVASSAAAAHVVTAGAARRHHTKNNNSQRCSVIAPRRVAGAGAAAAARRRSGVIGNAEKQSGKGGILFGGETSPPLPSFDDSDPSDEFEPHCAVAYASVDNDAHPTSSLLQVTVSAVPGVMRILSWLLNGLDLDLVEAEWEIEDVDEEGEADILEIKMWVTEFHGKGSGKVADVPGLEERLTEYLRFCTSAERKYHPVVEHGGVMIDNLSDPSTTVLTVTSKESGGESLLSVASTITGLGLRMKRARLLPTSKGAGSSVWEFHLTVMETKMKLTSAQVQGLLYTLCLVFNKSKKFGGADYLVEKMTSVDEGDLVVA
jgi:hypothetical protein